MITEMTRFVRIVVYVSRSQQVNIRLLFSFVYAN